MSNPPWEEGFNPDEYESEVPELQQPVKIPPLPMAMQLAVTQPEPPKPTRPVPDPVTGFIPIPTLDEVWRQQYRLKPAPGTEALPDLPGKPSWSLSECLMAQRFASEYLRDFNARNAWTRAGGVETGPAGGYARYVQHPYVQAILEQFVEQIEEEQLLTRKKVIGGLLKEAHYFGPDASHGGRIRAWMGLARIKKMDVQVTENTTTVRGGVMLIPSGPGGEIIDVEMWEKASEEQQTQLKTDVRK